jgi:hypothetical protein
MRFPFAVVAPLLFLTACGGGPPAPRATPGVRDVAFRGPQDTLTEAEKEGLHEAVLALRPDLAECAREGAQFGIVSSSMVARVRVRKDGIITAVGFDFQPESDAAASYASCMRAAVSKMNLRSVPWESDRKVKVRLVTR